MGNKTAALLISMSCCFGFIAAAGSVSAKDEGAAKFAQHCSVCHPNGGNIINPAKTLHEKDRKANNVTTAADVIHLMRHPGPGMTRFDENAVSNEDAHEIAEYVIKTFK